jgi:hypothetical protein
MVYGIEGGNPAGRKDAEANSGVNRTPDWHAPSSRIVWV